MTSRRRACAVEQSRPAARSSAIRLTWTARVMTAHGSSAHLTRTCPHGLEGGVRRVLRLAVMGARQRSVLADRELHEPLGLTVLPPSPVADALAVVEALEDGPQAFGGGERGAHSPSPSGLAADVVGRFGAEWRIVRVAVVGVRRARRTSSAWRSIPRPTIGPTYEPSSVGRTQATRFCVCSRAGCVRLEGRVAMARELAGSGRRRRRGRPAAPAAGSCGGGTRRACSQVDPFTRWGRARAAPGAEPGGDAERGVDRGLDLAVGEPGVLRGRHEPAHGVGVAEPVLGHAARRPEEGVVAAALGSQRDRSRQRVRAASRRLACRAAAAPASVGAAPGTGGARPHRPASRHGWRRR